VRAQQGHVRFGGILDTAIGMMDHSRRRVPLPAGAKCANSPCLNLGGQSISTGGPRLTKY
jgi:hypothetical protein